MLEIALALRHRLRGVRGIVEVRWDIFKMGHFQNGHFQNVPRFRRPSVDSGLNKARSVAKRGDRALKFITSRLAYSSR